ncbi:hypothetical protein FA15DRAFT_676628 [Coprinopsis marcescibilis]|uniref:Uncharacterized protein n=1 Tax=Coprinopsis marcescibilis TaxID=230819 RepID=A0A5C3K9K1_COPMA|nr:hypothetical protein FA15DRAFT_676628 [Coprinopsis marcescibilis]
MPRSANDHTHAQLSASQPNIIILDTHGSCNSLFCISVIALAMAGLVILLVLRDGQDKRLIVCGPEDGFTIAKLSAKKPTSRDSAERPPTIHAQGQDIPEDSFPFSSTTLVDPTKDQFLQTPNVQGLSRPWPNVVHQEVRSSAGSRPDHATAKRFPGDMPSSNSNNDHDHDHDHDFNNTGRTLPLASNFAWASQLRGPISNQQEPLHKPPNDTTHQTERCSPACIHSHSSFNTPQSIKIHTELVHDESDSSSSGSRPTATERTRTRHRNIRESSPAPKRVHLHKCTDSNARFMRAHTPRSVGKEPWGGSDTDSDSDGPLPEEMLDALFADALKREASQHHASGSLKGYPFGPAGKIDTTGETQPPVVSVNSGLASRSCVTIREPGSQVQACRALEETVPYQLESSMPQPSSAHGILGNPHRLTDSPVPMIPDEEDDDEIASETVSKAQKMGKRPANPDGTRPSPEVTSDKAQGGQTETSSHEDHPLPEDRLDQLFEADRRREARWYNRMKASPARLAKAISRAVGKEDEDLEPEQMLDRLFERRSQPPSMWRRFNVRSNARFQ